MLGGGVSVHANNSPEAQLEMADNLLKKTLGFKQNNIQQALLHADSLDMLALRIDSREHLFEAAKIKGDIYHQIGKHEDGFRWLNKAFSIALEIPDTLRMVKIFNNLGGIFHDSGLFDKALQHYTQAYLLGEHLLEAEQKSVVLSNIALVYMHLENFPEAHTYYRKALDLVKHDRNSSIYAYLQTNLGSLYNKENKKEKALSHLRNARKMYEESGNELGLAECLVEFANVFTNDNPEVSLDYLVLAKKIYDRQHDKMGIFYLYESAGDAYTQLGDYQDALLNYENALEVSDSLRNAEIKGKILLNIAGIYRKLESHDLAGRYYQEFIALEKEKDKRALLRNLAGLKLNYEIGLKENRIKELEEETAQAQALLRSRNLIISIMIGLTILVVFLAVFFVHRFKNLNKLNRALVARNKLVQAQKLEIQEQNRIIQKKQYQLEKTQKVSDEYFVELLSVKEQLEEKVKDRTRELEGTYKKLAFHINNTPLAVMEWNSNLELIRWPPQAEKIFGFSEDEVLGLRMNEVPFVEEVDRVEIENIILQLISGNLPLQYFTKQNRGRFGEVLFIEWSYSALLGEDGKPKSILTIANDVTIRERTFRELKSANKELDTFLYKSSHDLRGPLARMQGIINLGLLETADPQAKQYFEMLKKVTQELNTLLLRLMSVHNINQHEFKIQEMNFSTFIARIIDTVGTTASTGQQVEIVNKVPKDLIIVSDYSLLNIIIFNLLQNGLRFADNFNPKIEIDAIYLPSGKYLINVSDNGMRVPNEFSEKIFDMFFQGSTRSTGIGLGLYMVKKAVKKLGGDIKLYSEKGCTVFEIELPAEKSIQRPKIKVLN